LASIAKREDGRWRARYRDENGRDHARHFRRRQDAQRWLDEVTTAVTLGQYVDPKAGRVTFTSFYRDWATRQVWESTTEKAMDLSARTVTFGDVPMNKLRRSHLERWVKIMTDARLKPGTIRTRTNNVRSVLRAAVRDRVIALDPSQCLVLPRVGKPDLRATAPTNALTGGLCVALHVEAELDDVAVLRHVVLPSVRAFPAARAAPAPKLDEDVRDDLEQSLSSRPDRGG